VSKVEMLPGATVPSLRLTDTRFKYTPASHTDISKRFAPLFDEAERLEQERQRASFENGGKTGWPPGLLQDDCKGLSRWLASKPDARAHVRDVSATLERENVTQMRRAKP
jgi:hypothetical protein